MSCLPLVCTLVPTTSDVSGVLPSEVCSELGPPHELCQAPCLAEAFAGVPRMGFLQTTKRRGKLLMQPKIFHNTVTAALSREEATQGLTSCLLPPSISNPNRVTQEGSLQGCEFFLQEETPPKLFLLCCFGVLWGARSDAFGKAMHTSTHTHTLQHTPERRIDPAMTTDRRREKGQNPSFASLYSVILQITHPLHVQWVKLLETKSLPYLLV